MFKCLGGKSRRNCRGGSNTTTKKYIVLSYLNSPDWLLIKTFFIKARQIHSRQPDARKIIAQLTDPCITCFAYPAPKLIRLMTMIQHQSLVRFFTTTFAPFRLLRSHFLQIPSDLRLRPHALLTTRVKAVLVHFMARKLIPPLIGPTYLTRFCQCESPYIEHI